MLQFYCGGPYMITATIEFMGGKSAGIVFGQSASRPGVVAELCPQEGPSGQVSLAATSGQAMQTRQWPLPGRVHQFRLLVVEQMVDIYVDDVLVLNRCVPELRPGAVSLSARNGPVAFKEVRYYAADGRPLTEFKAEKEPRK